MSDLVKHLRESATDLCSPGGCCYAESMVKAADEIERLQAEAATEVKAADIYDERYIVRLWKAMQEIERLTGETTGSVWDTYGGGSREKINQIAKAALKSQD